MIATKPISLQKKQSYLARETKLGGQELERGQASDKRKSNHGRRDFDTSGAACIGQIHDCVLVMCHRLQLQGKITRDTPQGQRLADKADAQNDDRWHVQSDRGVAPDAAEEVKEKGLMQMLKKVVQAADRGFDQARRKKK